MADWDLILFNLQIWKRERNWDKFFQDKLVLFFADSKGSAAFFSHFRLYSRHSFKPNQRLLLLQIASVFWKLWMITHYTSQKYGTVLFFFRSASVNGVNYWGNPQTSCQIVLPPGLVKKKKKTPPSLEANLWPWAIYANTIVKKNPNLHTDVHSYTFPTLNPSQC